MKFLEAPWLGEDGANIPTISPMLIDLGGLDIPIRTHRLEKRDRLREGEKAMMVTNLVDGGGGEKAVSEIWERERESDRLLSQESIFNMRETMNQLKTRKTLN